MSGLLLFVLFGVLFSCTVRSRMGYPCWAWASGQEVMATRWQDDRQTPALTRNVDPGLQYCAQSSSGICAELSRRPVRVLFAGLPPTRCTRHGSICSLAFSGSTDTALPPRVLESCGYGWFTVRIGVPLYNVALCVPGAPP